MALFERDRLPSRSALSRFLAALTKAQIIAHRTFTIQLTWQCEAQIQPITCGIDKGSSTTGLACIGNEQVLLAAEIHHRRDVKEKMDDRRDRRKSRRQRKWYRPKRFANRASSKRSERLPPSIKTNVEEVIRQIPLPISHIVIEDVQVDIARLNTPGLQGNQYQDPTLLDENLRMACLVDDPFLLFLPGATRSLERAQRVSATRNRLLYAYHTSSRQTRKRYLGTGMTMTLVAGEGLSLFLPV